MLRVRAIIIIAFLIAVIYALAPAERKKRWLDKFREFAKALSISLVLYWAYMFVMLLLRQQ